MEVSTMPENQNNIFESIIKTNEGGGVPPAGYIAAMSAYVELNKRNTRSEKYEGSYLMSISLMLTAAVLKIL